MKHGSRGFTLIELLIAMALGAIVIAGAITVFSAMRKVYNTSLAQASMQDASNAISALVSPPIRGAGFGGCGTLSPNDINIIDTTSTLKYDFGRPIVGFDASGTPGTTSGTGTNATTLAGPNPANDAAGGDWTPDLAPALPAALKGSDVLVVSGEMPRTAPAGVNVISKGASDFIATDNPLSDLTTIFASTNLPAPAAVSDCGKSAIFMVTAMSGSGATVKITHADNGTGTNIRATFLPTPPKSPFFAPGAQFAPLQQSVFYVAHGTGGQSSLYQAKLTKGVWAAQPLVAGVENMQVAYGVTNGATYQWLPAGAVSDWTQVTAVQLGFLMAGRIGSADYGARTRFDVLGTTVTVPADSRMRHTYQLTIYIRNQTL